MQQKNKLILSHREAIFEQKAQMRAETILQLSQGDIVEGPIVKVTDFGAFVTILPGRDGLVHISQIAEERIDKVSDRLHEGQIVRVKVLEIDRQGRIRLTMKDVTEVEA